MLVFVVLRDPHCSLLEFGDMPQSKGFWVPCQNYKAQNSIGESQGTLKCYKIDLSALGQSREGLLWSFLQQESENSKMFSALGR